MKKQTINETETVFIPKSSKHDDAQFVSVNGQRILVRKGEAVTLPVKYAEVIKNAEAAAKYAEQFIDSVANEV